MWCVFVAAQPRLSALEILSLNSFCTLGVPPPHHRHADSIVDSIADLAADSARYSGVSSGACSVPDFEFHSACIESTLPGHSVQGRTAFTAREQRLKLNSRNPSAIHSQCLPVLLNVCSGKLQVACTASNFSPQELPRSIRAITALSPNCDRIVS